MEDRKKERERWVQKIKHIDKRILKIVYDDSHDLTYQ